MVLDVVGCPGDDLLMATSELRKNVNCTYNLKLTTTKSGLKMGWIYLAIGGKTSALDHPAPD